MHPMLSTSFYEIENKKEAPSVIILYPDWHDYEAQKGELRELNLPSEEYEKRIKILAEEFDM